MLEAQREVEDALIGFIRAQEQVGYLQDSVKAAQRSVDLALIQYRDGVADYQRVLDTQQALVAQQDLLSATQGDIATNLIAMYRALGGGWQFRQTNDFLPATIKQEMKERSDWGDLLDSEANNKKNTDKSLQSPDW